MKCKKETKIIPKHLICIRNAKKETKIIPKHLICIRNAKKKLKKFIYSFSPSEINS